MGGGAEMFALGGERTFFLPPTELNRGACGMTCSLSVQVVAVVGTALIMTGCSVSFEGFGAECVASIVADAAQTPETHTIAANVATQFGLVQRADPNGPPVATKQVGFATPDGATHYFAVPQPSAERLALMRLTPGSSNVRVYVIDREGNLLQATETDPPHVLQLNMEDEEVRSDFRRERELWRFNGRDEFCGRG